MKCSVHNCDNDNKKNYKALSFFRFPDDPELSKQWLKFCRMKKPMKGAVVCMAHFKNEDIEGSLMYDLGFSSRRHLKPGVVPSIIEKYKNEKTLLREERAAKRNNKKIVDNLLKEAEVANALNENSIENFADIELNPSSTLDEDETNPLEDQPYKVSLQPTQFSIQTKDAGPKLALLINDDELIEINEIEDCGEYKLDCIEPLVVIKTLNKEIELLKNENENLKNQLENKEYLHKKEIERMQRWLDRAKFENTIIESKLATIFTKGQIQKLKMGPRKQYWSEEDIAHSISLYTISGRAYQSLLNNNYPLPSIRTLQNWARKSYLAQRNGSATSNTSSPTATLENDVPIYEELQDDENISDLVKRILEEDINDKDIDDSIEENMEEKQCEESVLVSNDVDIEILSDNEIETIEVEVEKLSDMDIENVDVQ